MELVTFIQGLTLVLGFYMAWNIGANDVANAMGTSVGSKALTLKKAVFLAAVLEFSGAYFIGSRVSETIQKGIVEPSIFQSDPMIFVLGMMGALLATGALLQLASYLALPISTTHAIVGAVLGFGLCTGGFSAIHWNKLGWIAMSWVLSPVVSGCISYGIFSLIEKRILQVKDPLEAAHRWAPWLVFGCVAVTALSLVYHSLNLELSFPSALALCCLAGLTASLLARLFVLRKEPALIMSQGVITNSENSAEKLFIFLQILSACLVAFAHGTNDVSNAIGPVAAVFAILKTQTITHSSTIPSWLLALGGGGIVIGLATWGWRVIETVGKKITILTPTRGFAAEFGAAITILFASKLGLPISTTHALIGAVLGVGMSRGLHALNLPTIKEIIISWAVTIPLCALFSIFIFFILKFCFT